MKRSMMACLSAVACAAASSASAQTGSGIEQVVVTATRVPEAGDRVPADISVVSAPELETRDAWDMGTALSLVPGVEAPPGGDAGPSSAVPSFWGLHEFDAFLLVADGVPWGGAFNPAISTLDMNDVERVEVLKGSAPVMYGATSFVGVVQLLHYPAGEAASQIDIEGGNYGSARGSASIVLPQFDDYRESLAVDGQSTGFADRRENVSDGQLLYRGALDMGPGTLRFDANLTFVRDVPPSPLLRVGTGLTDVTPINANFNPANSEIDENKYQGEIGYTRPTGLGTWDTLLSYAHSDIIDIRAFLHPDLSGTADTQDQHRLINDGYFDTHITNEQFENLTLIFGTDLLYGVGRQTSANGNSAYTVPLNGSVLPPPTTQLPVNEIGTTDDHREFAGQYAQFDWKADSRFDVIGGFRLNETFEQKSSSDFTLPPPALLSEKTSNTVVRPSGTVGISYRAWSDNADEAVLYADYRDAFKPAAIDFGPDYTPDILLPETAQSYEGGVKGALGSGHLTYQAELFLQNFENLVVATPSGALANAAKEQLKGVELETHYLLAPDLSLAANIAYHDARFGQYLFFDGVSTVNVAGRELTLSPHILASGGLLYTPAQGFNATFLVNYVGQRFLDEENTASVGGYTTLAATLGYRFDRYLISAEGENLTNQRPPVSSSEFGSQSFYLLPARTLWLRLGYSL
ncbi:MAG TPA: TonB-dependent receptor plug domain-containing protein [Rhizomicrobium sp.]|jgi:outer membrane receptor protein involved in Fe transport